jgi:4-cresol dehydrogenase (hydroxylating)
MASVYWRKKTPPPASPDPDRDRCGLLWCSPVLPNTGPDAEAVTTLVTRLLLEHGFEPQMSLSLAGERMIICIITIAYDRDVPGEDERALACYRQLSEAMIAKGYPPYRLSVASMTQVDSGTTYGAALSAIRLALDPNGIMAPGRYQPES